jgi:predicted enzyme related to lactoylglutathione lyase
MDNVDMKLEVAIIPVSDVDRAKKFYESLGWRTDVTPPWVVQMTPPGSPCSIQFGGDVTAAAPGSAKSYLVVSDIQAAMDQLAAAGVEMDEVTHIGEKGLESGLDPERRSYFSRALFSDPDGNGWLMQEVTTRLPGRIDSGVTSYGSVNDLAGALRRAEAAHGQHEARTGVRDEDWPDWYATYMASEQSGEEPPT